MPAKLYVALGDSMTISYYPSIDAATRYGRRIDNLGAAHLLHTNNDELFPEFKGNDLRSHYCNIEIDDLSSDGATLPTVNDHVRRTAITTSRCTLADVHKHFLGHGVKVPVAKRWYWSESIIEPGFAGASEIRRMWWSALQSEIGNHRDL